MEKSIINCFPGEISLPEAIELVVKMLLKLSFSLGKALPEPLLLGKPRLSWEKPGSATLNSPFLKHCGGFPCLMGIFLMLPINLI